MLVCEVIEGGYKFVEEIEVLKGRRLDVALRNWVEKNNKEKPKYVGLKLLVQPMKVKRVSKVEVVYA